MRSQRGLPRTRPLLAAAASANYLAGLLEAALPKRGLKHPRHQRHLKPARARLKDLIVGYFRRQEDALKYVNDRLRLYPNDYRLYLLQAEGYAHAGKGLAQQIAVGDAVQRLAGAGRIGDHVGVIHFDEKVGAGKGERARHDGHCRKRPRNGRNSFSGSG